MLNTVLLVILALVALVLLLFIGAIGSIYFLRAEKHFRDKSMSRLASELNMAHDPTEKRPEEIDLPVMDLYRDAGPCIISNLVTHESESRSVRIFEVFCAGYYRQDATHRITVIALNASNIELPDFSLIYKDGYVDRIDSCKGVQGLEFKHCWDLTNLYLLRSEEPEVLSTLLTDNFVKTFKSLGNCSIEYHTGWLFVYRPATARTMSRKEVVQRIERALAFLESLEVMLTPKITRLS